MRVTIAQRVDGDAGMEIEIGSALLVEQSHAFAPLESKW
jgi:hypothetical protein